MLDFYGVMCHVCAKVLQLCLTLCNPMDCSLPGSSVHGFSRQEYWSGLPYHLLGDLPNPEMEPASLFSLALAGGFFTTSPGAQYHFTVVIFGSGGRTSPAYIFALDLQLNLHFDHAWFTLHVKLNDTVGSERTISLKLMAQFWHRNGC